MQSVLGFLASIAPECICVAVYKLTQWSLDQGYVYMVCFSEVPAVTGMVLTCRVQGAEREQHSAFSAGVQVQPIVIDLQPI